MGKVAEEPNVGRDEAGPEAEVSPHDGTYTVTVDAGAVVRHPEAQAVTVTVDSTVDGSVRPSRTLSGPATAKLEL